MNNQMEHQSAEVDKIFPAVVALQSEINNPAKSKQGHGYKYADLAQIITLSRDPLSANGLAVTQFCASIDGASFLVTQMIHSSGQWIRGFYPLEKAGMAKVNDAQQMGAAMTYARRYNLAAILGVAQEDDDAANVGKPPQRQQQQQQQQQQGNQQGQQGRQRQQQAQGEQATISNLSEAQIVWARGKVSEGWAADHLIASFQKRGALSPAVVKQLTAISKGA